MKVTISPEMASEMLAKANGQNYRKKDPGRVRQYAEAMAQGRWEYNGETIKLDREGVLVDGQHRLSACVESGSPFITEMVEGIDTTLEVDRGKARNISDALRNDGRKCVTTMSGVINWCWRYAHERTMMSNLTATVAEALRLSRLPKFVPAFEMFLSMPIIFRKGSIGAVMVLTLLADDESEDAKEFWDGANTGSNLIDGDPRLVLRNRLIANKAATGKLRPHVICALTIKAFNAFKEDRTVKCLKWARMRKDREPFPQINGLSPADALRLLECK